MSDILTLNSRAVHTHNTSALTASTCHAQAATRVQARYLSLERTKLKKPARFEPILDSEVPSESSATTSTGKRMSECLNLVGVFVVVDSTSSEVHAKSEISL
jgi:hypothetical protein